jgi:hypothetical protein
METPTDKEMLDWMTTQMEHRSDDCADSWRLDVFLMGTKSERPDIREVIESRMNHVKEYGY